MARKERTIAHLKQIGIPTNDWLPYIGDDEIVLREPREVAERTVAVCAVAVHAEMHHSGRTEPFARQFLEHVGLVSALSPLEHQFLDEPKPDVGKVIQFSWRYEACATLLWALQLLDELPFPDDICDVPLVSGLARELGASPLDAVQLRSADEIADQLDLTYRLHWAVRDAQLRGRELPGNLNGGVVFERHWALNWLTSRDGTAWDDTDTST